MNVIAYPSSMAVLVVPLSRRLLFDRFSARCYTPLRREAFPVVCRTLSFAAMDWLQPVQERSFSVLPQCRAVFFPHSANLSKVISCHDYLPPFQLQFHILLTNHHTVPGPRRISFRIGVSLCVCVVRFVLKELDHKGFVS